MHEGRRLLLGLLLVTAFAGVSVHAKDIGKQPAQPEFTKALRVDTEQSREALSVAVRISQASAKLEAPKLSEGMLRSLLSVAFQGEADVDALVDVQQLIKIINNEAGKNPGKEIP